MIEQSLRLVEVVRLRLGERYNILSKWMLRWPAAGLTDLRRLFPWPVFTDIGVFFY